MWHHTLSGLIELYNTMSLNVYELKKKKHLTGCVIPGLMQMKHDKIIFIINIWNNLAEAIEIKKILT